MTSPSFDSDGYPTEDTLQTIAIWDHAHGLPEWLDYCRDSWHPDGKVTPKLVREFGNPVNCLSFVTGGWSGNESVISAMQQNTVLWSLTWYSSKRGGLHMFEVRGFN